MTRTDTQTADPRRDACILITAQDGHIRAARGLVGRAIRQALGVKRWCHGAHWVSYLGAAASYGTPRFLLSLNDAEFNAVMVCVDSLALAEGWDCAPIDAYHD